MNFTDGNTPYQFQCSLFFGGIHITNAHIRIGNSMVSSAINLEKTCTSEFFKDDQNCTSPKDECNLKSLKNSRVYVFSNCTRNHTNTC